MKLNSVHVRSLAINASNISIETIDGDDHYVIRGVVPIVDDVVMNGGLYLAAEINKSYQTLEGKPMPMGHPKIGADYVSADNPRAVNQFHVGAWQENVRKDGERVVMDMKVNKRYAESTDKGKRLIERLDAMVNGDDVEPIHVSTGLLLQREANTGKSKGKKHTWIARNMSFDHTAILLDEPGAATPGDGVGIFVNADGDKFDIEQVNLTDAADLTKDGILNKAKFYFTNASNFSFDDIHSALRAKLRQKYTGDEWPYPEAVWPDKFIYYLTGKTYQQKYLIDDNGTAEFVGEPVEVVRKPTEYEIKTNGANNPMKDIIANALKAKGKPTEGKTEAELLDAYNQMNAEDAATKTETPEQKTAREKKEADEKAAKDKANNNEQAPAWFAPFAEKLNSIETGLTANSDKEKDDKRNAVKAKFGLNDAAVNALDGVALDGLYAQCPTSTGLNGTFRQANSTQTFSEMPE
ncbi:gp7 [Serratia fonticola AU-P3(3)]|nr:gp7 [Serratia fonticola AU-P3(3)]